MQLSDFQGYITPLIAGFVGAAFNAWFTSRRERRNKEEQAKAQTKAIRTLLSCEMEHNLNLLRETYISSLGFSSSPKWWRQAFITQIQVLTVALSAEEIEKTYSVYSRLDTIEDIGKLLEKTNEQLEQLNDAIKSTKHMLVPVDVSVEKAAERTSQKVDELRSRSDQMVKELLEIGNPLNS